MWRGRARSALIRSCGTRFECDQIGSSWANAAEQKFVTYSPRSIPDMRVAARRCTRTLQRIFLPGSKLWARLLEWTVLQLRPRRQAPCGSSFIYGTLIGGAEIGRAHV